MVSFAVMMAGDVWGKFLKLKKIVLSPCTCWWVCACTCMCMCVVYGTVMSS